MGRTRQEGPKQLSRVVDNPRFTRVFVCKGNARMPVLMATSSFSTIAAGFERRGYTVEKA